VLRRDAQSRAPSLRERDARGVLPPAGRLGVRGDVYRTDGDLFDVRAFNVCDEKRGDIRIKVLLHGVVVFCTRVPECRKLVVADLVASCSEDPKRVLRLSNHDNVSHDTEKIRLSERIDGVSRPSQGGANGIFDCAPARWGADGVPISFNQYLVVLKRGKVLRAEVPKYGIIGLFLVVSDRVNESFVLHDAVIDLGAQKVVSCVHGRVSKEGMGLEESGVEGVSEG